MDILHGNPLLILILIVGSIPLLWYLKRRKLKCNQCGKRAMQEARAVPEGTNFTASHHDAGRARVGWRVTYKCERCGASFETLEHRS